MKEFTRPPYFLDHLLNDAKQKTGKEEQTQDSNTKSSRGVGSASKADKHAQSDNSHASGSHSSQDGNGDATWRTRNVRGATQRGQKIGTASTGPDDVPGGHARRRLDGPTQSQGAHDFGFNSDETGGITSFSHGTSIGGKGGSTDIIHAGTSLTHVGPSTNWQLVFRKSGFPVSLQKAFAWDIQQAELRHGVMRIETAKGNYALKRGHLSPEKLRFIEDAFKFIIDQGFHQFAPLYLSRAGKPYVVREQQTYYATKWIPGQPVNFASLLQVRQVARTLAQIHEVSRGFETDVYTPRMEFALDNLLRERTEDLKALLARVQTRTNPDAFDRALASHASELRRDAEESIRMIESNACLSELRDAEETPGLCHLDVIPGNFIYTPEQHAVAIDFDMCTYAPRALDLSHLLRRALQQQHWLPDVAYTCFVEYNAAHEMSTSEYRLVEALLRFPYRAWRVAHSRYRMEAGDGQLEELESAVRELPRRETFLDSFSRQIER